MVSFIRKRLQVFVSSTYSDLKHERQAAVEAILLAGHIPAGMELFASGDESQMEVIKQWIDESDAFLLILGGRYGSIEPRSGKSYTHLEYEYAVANAKPLFAAVITDKALENKIKTDGREVLELEEPKQLREFKTQVLARTVRFWDDHKDIRLAIAEALSNFARRDELVGWVRSDTQADMPALADEIARLSKENSQLREREVAQLDHLIHGLSFGELEQLLKSRKLLKFFVEKRQDFVAEHGFSTDYNQQVEAVCEDLVAVGLLIRVNMTNFVLTDEGRSFLNRYLLSSLPTVAQGK